MKLIDVVIRGVAPGLLQHRFPEVAQAGLINPVKSKSPSRPTREEEAESFCYRLESGNLCQPAEHIYQACIRAAVEFQMHGRSKKSYKDAFKGGVLIVPELIDLGIASYEIDSRPVVVQRARVIRHRPLIREWELAFQLQMLDGDAIPNEVLNAILVRAGQTVGIGDYRPRYGRFVVAKFEPV